MNIINVIQRIQELIQDVKDHDGSVEEISDGYHSFKELYAYRLAYNALLFNEWAQHISELLGSRQGVITKRKAKYDVHKSKRHSDGELCFGGGWFVVVAMTPHGQITNHYEDKHWDMFKIPEEPKAKYEYDGHSSEEALERLNKTILE